MYFSLLFTNNLAVKFRLVLVILLYATNNFSQVEYYPVGEDASVNFTNKFAIDKAILIEANF